MADGFIQLPGDSTGKKLDTSDVNLGAGSTSLHRERMVLADPVTTGGFATVTSSAGVLATLSSGTVTLSSVHTVTATAAANPWSSAPGFNIPVVSVSSGLVQISGVPTVTATAGTNPWSSAPGFNIPVVSVSSGLVQISGTPTVTATAATNPWSSAPSFNIPVVTVSSGLVQISGTPTVLSASSGFVQAYQAGTWTLQTTAGTAIATSSSLGIPNYSGVTPTSSVAGAGIAPVTSSAGLLASLSSGTVTLSSVHTVTATGPVTITSGLVSVTSGTITSTAATNPWSSAPGFNVPVVSASSGLIQLSSQITVTATGPVTVTSGLITLSTAAFNPITVATTSPASVAVTSSAGPAVSLGVQSAAGYGPVTSSAGQLSSLSSGTVTLSSQITVTNVSVSSGLVQALMSTGTAGGVVSTYFALSTVKAIKTSAGRLMGVIAYTTIQSASPVLVFYDMTTGNVSVGTSMNLVMPISLFTTGAGLAIPEADLSWFGPNGINFGTAISVAPQLSATGGVLSTTTFPSGISCSIQYL